MGRFVQWLCIWTIITVGVGEYQTLGMSNGLWRDDDDVVANKN